MTRLREALGDIAADAPMVNLADLVIAGHRRRRIRTALAITSVTALAVAGATSAALVMPWHRLAADATPQNAVKVPELPEGKVGAVSHAYRTACTAGQAPRTIDCGPAEWRVVTAGGTTYRMPQALAFTAAHNRVPLALSRDGRKLAYYSDEAAAFVVRDLMTGREVTSPIRFRQEEIKAGAILVLSDDGRHLAFDPLIGKKRPTTLIDLRTGRAKRLNSRYEPISIKQGVVELVRYVKTDLWRMPVAGGGKPVRFKGAWIGFSELHQDGRTVVAIDHADYRKGARTTFGVLDAETGRIVRKVQMTGVPATTGIDGLSVWRSEKVVTVATSVESSRRLYAVDVTTGTATLLTDLGTKARELVLPGDASGK
ncbi:hypothetical protein GCM10009733_066110 [Nonomuraea maheshkhaliensis]|uniref:WD40 repeat domain-containing protein n=1 Tax=Nonomuraea maheshkhaliensis TaxID=419590 RepID=A0ABP4RPH2_9ACTN